MCLARAPLSLTPRPATRPAPRPARYPPPWPLLRPSHAHLDAHRQRRHSGTRGTTQSLLGAKHRALDVKTACGAKAAGLPAGGLRTANVSLSLCLLKRAPASSRIVTLIGQVAAWGQASRAKAPRKLASYSAELQRGIGDQGHVDSIPL